MSVGQVAARPKTRWLPQIDSTLFGVVALMVIAFVGYPLVMSLRLLNLADVGELFSESNFVPVRNSVMVAVIALVPSILIAVPLAFLCARTDVPFRKGISTLIATSFVVPMLLTSIAYVFLFGRNAGLVNVIFKQVFGAPLFDVFSFAGVVLIAILHSYPLIFFTTASGLSNMNPELEESARISGMTPLQVYRRITIGAILPSIMAGVAFSIAANLTLLSGPLVLGSPVGISFVTTEMYAAVVMSPNLGRAVALSLPLICATVLALYLQSKLIGNSRSRFALVSGKGAKGAELKLGRWRYLALVLCLIPIFFSLGLPSLTLLAAGMMKHWWKGVSVDNLHWGNFAYLFTDPITQSSVWNTVILSIGSGVVIALFGAVISAVLGMRQTRASAIVHALAELPLGIPYVVAGLLVLLAWYGSPFQLGGSLWILLFGYILLMLPYGLRTCDVAREQIDHSLPEAGRIAGMTTIGAWWHVTLPLMRNGMATTFVIVFLFVIKEFPMTALVYSSETLTLAVRTFNLYEGGSFEKTGAASVLLLLLTFLILIIANRVSKISIDTMKT